MFRPRLVPLIACATLLSAFLSFTQAQDLLTPESAVALTRASQAQLSPDGAWIAYQRSIPRSAEDDPGDEYSELWLAPVDGGAPRRFTRSKGDAHAPHWSPDGQQLAFLATRDEVSAHTQIFAMRIDGGEARALTDHETSIANFRWSPDASLIAFTAPDPTTEDQQEDEKHGRDWKIAHAGDKPDRLWILELESGQAEPVYKSDISTGDFVWTPDGRNLVIRAAKTPYVDDAMVFSALLLVPAGGGEPTPIGRTEGKLGGFAVSPGGSQLAYLAATAQNDPLPQNVFVVDLPAGEPRLLTRDWPESAEQVAWNGDADLIVLSNARERTVLSTVDLAGNRRAVALTDPPIAEEFDLGGDGETLAIIGSTSGHPSEVFVASLREKSCRRLTHHAAALLDAVRLPKQEAIKWQTDDLSIGGVLTYPVGYEPGRRYPTIIHPHGGPEGVSQDGWSTFAQLLAARGYLVLQPNYRGSGGRGVAFSKGDHDDLGGKEFGDILAGLNKLVDDGLADPEHVGIGGWSYGGYLSALAATHHTEVFKAAVMGAGISNWVSFSGTTDIPHEMSLVHWNRYAYANLELFWERSPMSRINQADTPTLILHGADDARVHPGQAWELYTGLKMRNVPTQMVLYPRSGHGIGERAHRIDLYQRQLDWFDRYVK